jgi:hypothetical protein
MHALAFAVWVVGLDVAVSEVVDATVERLVVSFGQLVEVAD